MSPERSAPVKSVVCRLRLECQVLSIHSRRRSSSTRTAKRSISFGNREAVCCCLRLMLYCMIYKDDRNTRNDENGCSRNAFAMYWLIHLLFSRYVVL